jgi:hypothetical protein
MRKVVLVVAAVTLAGCAGTGSLLSSMTYIRADGSSVSTEQIDADKSGCASGSENTNRCMVAKGYFEVDVKDAEAKRAQLAQIAEANRKREEERLAAERKKQEELERAARRKAKKKKTPPPANTGR